MRVKQQKLAAPTWQPPGLRGRVAIVAGASRGAGRGIALALGDTGATVYVTGRTTRRGRRPPDGIGGTIDDTAAEVTRRGGRGIAVRVDHAVESEVEDLYQRVRREQGRLDIVANAVWGGSGFLHEPHWQKRPFWELRSAGWQETMMAGAYAAYLNTIHAARLMAPRRRGLIVHVTELVLEKYDRGGPPFWMLWMLGHRVINRLVDATRADLAKRKITTIALAPGWMRTERVMKHTSAKEKKSVRFAKSESTEYAGRAVAMLAADPRVPARTGKLLYVGDLARHYGFRDNDGRAVPNFYKELKLI
ncbi:MAG TPA: SDR family NAD(P)-dependent oxidoreductase [Candidatus Acidoferrales bacterium]